jgi:hypothetical protein
MHGRNGAGCTTDVMVPARSQKVLRNHRAISGRSEKPTATRFTWSIKMSREHLARKYRHLSEKGKVALSCQASLLRNHSFEARSVLRPRKPAHSFQCRENERSDLPQSPDAGAIDFGVDGRLLKTASITSSGKTELSLAL